MEVNDRPVIVNEHRGIAQVCEDCGKTHHCPIPEDNLKAGLVGPQMPPRIGWLKGVYHMSAYRKFMRLDENVNCSFASPT